MPAQSNFSYYHSSLRPAPPDPDRRFASRWLFAGVLLAALGLYGFYTHAAKVHAHRLQTAAAQQAATLRTAKESVAVPKVLQVFADNSQVTFGVSIVDVQTGQATNLGTQAPFVAASTAKLLTAALYLHQVGTGQSSLSQHIDGTPATTLLERMIVNSDNDAWLDLNEYLTHPALLSYTKSLGIHDYDVTDNLLAPHDIALLLQKLANGSLLNHATSQLLLSYMAQANYRDDIVAAVPQGDTVYHKIGFLDDYLHDAAIIQNKAGRKVVLVIYTDGNGTYDDDARATAMHQITSAVLEGYL